MKLYTRRILNILAVIVCAIALTSCASSDKSPDETPGGLAGRPGQF